MVLSAFPSSVIVTRFQKLTVKNVGNGAKKSGMRNFDHEDFTKAHKIAHTTQPLFY